MHLSEKLLTKSFFRDLENRDWYRYCSPQGFYPLTHALIPWLAAAALISCAAGLYLGLFLTPPDDRLGAAARIVFVHVPASWMAVLVYLATAVATWIGLAFNARLALMAAQALAPTGLMFAFLGLWTGCLWHKPIWGTWWVWDLRTCSELTLAFVYIAFIGLHAATEDSHSANKAGALLLFAGALCIPVNFAAVLSWTAQHQGTLAGAAGWDPSELAGLLVMSLGFLAYTGATALLRLRCVILERERDSAWVAKRRNASP